MKNPQSLSHIHPIGNLQSRRVYTIHFDPGSASAPHGGWTGLRWKPGDLQGNFPDKNTKQKQTTLK